MLSRYPDPRMMNPPPLHLVPLHTATPVPAWAGLNPVAWRSRKWEGVGLIDSCQWLRIPGSSSADKSEVSVERR